MATFTDQDWQQILSYLTEVIGTEAQKYAANPAARLMACISYLSNSEDPDRFAVSNLLTFHAATKARKLFDHRPSDDQDLYRRLAAVHVGNHSDPHTVDYGMTLLAMISLNDHEHDLADDVRTGKYNPLAQGGWDAKALRLELESDLAKSPSLKQTYNAAVGMEVALQAWWED